jgi:hypothetical protein
MGTFVRRCSAAVAVAFLVCIGSAGATGSEFVDFAPAVSYPVDFEHGAAIADLTGDGRSDVLVSDSAAVHVFAQAADGSLGAPSAIPVYGSGFGIGDLTGDGGPDLAVSQTDSIEILSHLAHSSSIALGSHPEVIAPADLNSDGRVDLAVVTDVNGWGGVFVLLNTPVGWTTQQIGNLRAVELRIGDLNGDGRLDVVELPFGAMTQITIAYQQADGSFHPVDVTVSDSSQSGPSAFDVGDLTGDGRADIVVVSDSGGPYATVEVLAQTATGSLATPVRYATPDGPNLVSARDINGDGRSDVTVVYDSGVKMGVYLQRADGTLGAEQLFAIPYSGGSFRDPNGIAVGDADGDGLADIAIAYNQPSEGLVLVHQKNAASAPQPVAPPETTITGAPQSGTQSTTATFDFTASTTPATFRCALDSDTWSACSTPATYNGLAPGTHAFRVAAVDANGLADQTPATVTWSIAPPPPPADTTPPDTTLTSTPATSTQVTSARFNFTSTEAGSRFACSLDGRGYKVCSPPTSYAGLAIGKHRFAVRATDPAGNRDPTPASFTWTITRPRR